MTALSAIEPTSRCDCPDVVDASVLGMVLEALRPFADAFAQIVGEYDELAAAHGEAHVRRPSDDALCFTFSYGTLRRTSEALQAASAALPCCVHQRPGWQSAGCRGH